ncbi:MAG: NAD(P)H-hydrate dehydratase [Clostridia bacterium]|nr:NAD(P)H-hydrate dehydratase [Clostridia bacterium]
MKLVNVAQMRELERIAIEDYGVPSLLLMENAASGFVSALLSEYGEVSGKKVHVFCGRGNNGGDGFAIARMLKNLGAHVFITLLCDVSDVTGDAKINMAIAENMQIPFVESRLCYGADIIVDAIFGTGFHGETEGFAKEVIGHINESEAFVASVDIPSGLSADTGHASQIAVYADLCVTFAAAKPGHLLFPGKDHYKTLIKTDISVPQTVINDYYSGYDIIDKQMFSRLPKRHSNSHKGSFGKAIAFVGSHGIAGAACLASNAILKSGAGMATAAVPGEIFQTITAKLTSVMTCLLPKGSMSTVLAEKAKNMDVLLMGCGIGTDNEAVATVWHMLTETEMPTVLDADGLNAIAGCPHILKEAKGDLILTPHIVEFSRISGYSAEEIKAHPMEKAREFALAYGATLVLKDATTIVATKEGKLYISAGSNSGMATAGSGDVLSGIITGLLAQGADCETAAVCGVYIHLAAGALAKDKKGEYGMTAEDILEHVPYALMKETHIAPQIKE